MIKLIRIDYRLLHGQVVFAWINRLDIQRIIIIDDDAATDEMKKMSLKLTKPESTKLNIFSVEDAIARKNKIKGLSENIAIIFGSVESCFAFLKEFEGEVKEVNFGGIARKENSTQFDRAIFLTDEEVEYSKRLANLGYRLFSQQTPTTGILELNDRL